MDDLAAFGLQAPPAAEQALEIWPENLAIIEVFLACSTQWLFDFSGNRTGIRYEALQAAMTMMATPDVVGVFSGVRIMERAALAEFARAAEQRNR